MCVRDCAFIHIYIIMNFICMYINTRECTYIHTNAFIHIQTCTHACIYTQTYTYTYIYVIYMYIYIKYIVHIYRPVACYTEVLYTLWGGYD